jgi:GNAT superfamily N-acetyltransferase
MPGEFRFRPLEKSDCKKAAAIRLDAMEWGFLPVMGEAFYSELLKATCESKFGFGIICEDQNEKMAGFICAATHLQKYQMEIIMRRGAFLIFRALSSMLRQPQLISGLFQYFRYPQKMPCKNVKAEWLTMVVRKEYRGQGIGKKFTSSLIDEYKRRGVKQFISTVPSNNKISCAIHKNFGFRFLGTFSLHGDCINIYVYNIKANCSMIPILRK